jgi:hypothetical protein
MRSTSIGDCSGRRRHSVELLDPDGNNVEALYRDVGNVGHGVSSTLH